MALRSNRRPLNDAPKPASAPASASQPPAPVTARPQGYTAPSRLHRPQVVCYVDRATKRQLDTLAFEQERTLQSLCLEAFDLLFQTHGKPRIAVEGAAVPNANAER